MRLITQSYLALCITIIIFLVSCSALSKVVESVQEQDSLDTPSLVSPVAPVNRTSLEIFNYIWSLNGTSHGILGQNFMENNDWVQDYATVIEGFGALYGKYPAFATTEFYQGDVTSIQLGVEKLIAFFYAGGIVGANWMFSNPFTEGSPWDTSAVDGTRLLPGGDLRAAWIAVLDEIADTLTILKNNDVTVLWRPMQEMNGTWFWWANLADEDFKSIWRDMFSYLRDVKKLDNLLWVYCTVNGEIDYTAKYPGSDYVDFTGFDFYSNSYQWINIPQYRKLLSLGKPVFVPEAGLEIGNNIPRDIYGHIVELKRRCPEVHLINFWHSWRDDNGNWLKISMIDNLGVDRILADGWTLTRDELPEF